MSQQIPKSQENHYGGVRRHRVEHDPHILENFSDDVLDFQANSAQYNDFEEPRSLQASKVEPVRTGEHHPSNYSEGGHGHNVPASPPQENADNKDYSMNKDFSKGAKAKYENTEAKTRHHWWDIFRK